MAPASSSRTTTTIVMVILVRRCMCRKRLAWDGLHPVIHHLISRVNACGGAEYDGRSSQSPEIFRNSWNRPPGDAVAQSGGGKRDDPDTPESDTPESDTSGFDL